MNSDFQEHSRNSRAFPDGRKPGKITTVDKAITSQVAGTNMRITKTFSKFAVARYRKGYERSTEYLL